MLAFLISKCLWVSMWKKKNKISIYFFLSEFHQERTPFFYARERSIWHSKYLHKIVSCSSMLIIYMNQAMREETKMAIHVHLWFCFGCLTIIHFAEGVWDIGLYRQYLRVESSSSLLTCLKYRSGNPVTDLFSRWYWGKFPPT